MCDQLYGLDVSERAGERLPSARFGVGEITALPWELPPGGKYDLVVACKVLY